MNLNQFNQLVSDSLKRGNTFDAQIPVQTAMAVQWLERNFTMKYMEAFRLIEIVQGQRVIQMPKGLVKAWIFFRIINTDGTYFTVNKVEGKDLTAVDSTQSIVRSASSTVVMPRNFWQVGLSNIVLDAVPSDDFNAEAMFYNYSSWPTDMTTIPGGGSTFIHPLLDIAADMLLGQTQMFCAANLLKDLRMFQVYKEMRDEAVNTMTRSDDETKYGGEEMEMLYKPSYDKSPSTLRGF